MSTMLVACIFLSCSEKKIEKKEGSNNITEPIKAEEPVQVNPKSGMKEVVFFAPSSSELGALSENDPSGLNEVISDFDFYVNEFTQNPGRTDLAIRYEDENMIFFKLPDGGITFQRSLQPQQCGVILCDGKREPKILHGVLSDDEIRQAISEYFGS